MALHDDDRSAERPEGETPLNVSRRAFLKTVSATSVAAGVVGGADAEAQTGPAPVGPGEVAIQLTIDGKPHSLRVEPRVTLLDAMRERLDITSRKRVCDRGSCGACTVLVDGVPMKSCTMFAVQAHGSELTTVEGLLRSGAHHPIQEGFHQEHGLQCGFCTPGMMLTSVALLAENPGPTDEEIRWAISGQICRCTGYQNIVKAVQHAAAAMREEA